MIAGFEIDRELRRDWAAASDAARTIGHLPGHSADSARVAAYLAAETFGFGAIYRPTWVYVARSEHGTSMSASWFKFRWRRLGRQRRADRAYSHTVGCRRWRAGEIDR